MIGTGQGKMINAIQEQQAHWVTFAAKVMENSMKLFELNMRMAKESIDDSSSSIQYLLGGKAPEEMFKMDSGKMQEHWNRMMSYAKEMSEITSEFNVDLCHMTQSQFHDICEKTNGLVKRAEPMVPGNNQQTFDFMLSAFGNASRGYEQWMEAGKKFAQVVEHNLGERNLATSVKHNTPSSTHNGPASTHNVHHSTHDVHHAAHNVPPTHNLPHSAHHLATKGAASAKKGRSK